MRDYSPRRRTALVLAGSGAAGAYHAGVLKALDESGVKLDLIVGSGAGTVAAAFGAVSGGAKLYGPGGFWSDARWDSFYRLRPSLRVAILLLGTAFGVFLLPLILAIIVGMLSPLVFIADVIVPGLPGRLLASLSFMPGAIGAPYLAALAVPVFALSMLAAGFALRIALKHRRRAGELFESLHHAERARARLARGLWEIVRGPALKAAPPSEQELGKRYLALLAENLGQPGFRELVLRAADFERGRTLAFFALEDGRRKAFSRGRDTARAEAEPGAVDLRDPVHEGLLFDAVLSGLLPPLVAPLRRVSFPRGGLFAGETHRLGDATLGCGCGIEEALAAGAEQIIVATAVPEQPALSGRRRGPRALADGVLALLERQAVERDLETASRVNRMVETLGHRTEEGGRAWQDPATGWLYGDFGLYLIRPGHRRLGPLDLDGARDPATEVEEGLADLVEQGYRDAYRSFVAPVVGASAPDRPRRAVESEEGQPIEL